MTMQNWFMQSGTKQPAWADLSNNGDKQFRAIRRCCAGALLQQSGNSGTCPGFQLLGFRAGCEGRCIAVHQHYMQSAPLLASASYRQSESSHLKGAAPIECAKHQRPSQVTLSSCAAARSTNRSSINSLSASPLLPYCCAQSANRSASSLTWARLRQERTMSLQGAGNARKHCLQLLEGLQSHCTAHP